MLGGYGGLERTDFSQFPLWDHVVVLPELIFHSFYCWEGVVVLEELLF